MELKDKTAIVTGGASGLGEATVRMLAAEGARVVIVDVKDEEGSALAEQLGGAVRYCRADVTSEPDVQEAISFALNTFGGLHLNINCAGIVIGSKTVGKSGGAYGPHALDSFERTIRINLTGTFNVLRLCAFAMTRNDPDDEGERGVIVNTASIAAYDGQIGQAAYAASKGGIISMTLPVARDLAGSGIRVMTIAPGLFETPLLQGLPGVTRTALEQQIPFPSRLGRPEEYARLVKMIVENPMLNGEVIRLDGAVRMPPR